MQSNKLKISTKGQINDSKLSQDDYEANLLLVRRAIESMTVAYDCLCDLKTGLPHETSKCWRRRVLELLAEANNMTVFSVQADVVGIPKIAKPSVPDRMLGNAKISLNSLGGLEIVEEDDDEYEWTTI